MCYGIRLAIEPKFERMSNIVNTSSLTERWAKFKQEFVWIVLLSCGQVWWAFHNPIFVWLGSPWDSLLPICSAVVGVLVTIYVFAFADKLQLFTVTYSKTIAADKPAVVIPPWVLSLTASRKIQMALTAFRIAIQLAFWYCMYAFVGKLVPLLKAISHVISSHGRPSEEWLEKLLKKIPLIVLGVGSVVLPFMVWYMNILPMSTMNYAFFCLFSCSSFLLLYRATNRKIGHNHNIESC
ncbi:hypothetical protein M1466_01755 [Candidatus Dependentiae bacterium]|nr:hypothetical protein [Candidatus Dependentiae bacterium]